MRRTAPFAHKCVCPPSNTLLSPTSPGSAPSAPSSSAPSPPPSSPASPKPSAGPVPPTPSNPLMPTAAPSVRSPSRVTTTDLALFGGLMRTLPCGWPPTWRLGQSGATARPRPPGPPGEDMRERGSMEVQVSTKCAAQKRVLGKVLASCSEQAFSAAKRAVQHFKARRPAPQSASSGASISVIQRFQTAQTVGSILPPPVHPAFPPCSHRLFAPAGALLCRRRGRRPSPSPRRSSSRRWRMRRTTFRQRRRRVPRVMR